MFYHFFYFDFSLNTYLYLKESLENYLKEYLLYILMAESLRKLNEIIANAEQFLFEQKILSRANEIQQKK